MTSSTPKTPNLLPCESTLHKRLHDYQARLRVLILDRSRRQSNNNRIRGPQSALTDFLASNNISAAQISADYERRRREAQEQAERDAAQNAEAPEDEDDEELEAVVQKKKRKRQEEKALAKIKDSKLNKKKKKGKGPADSEDEDGLFEMQYSKKTPMPGQLENCEICGKRFTVTPYSKTGPDGGLLCTKCSKEQETERKKDQKAKAKSGPRERRRQTQSNLLDGLVQHGSKSLKELCVEQVANNIHDVEEFGDLPSNLLNRLSQILSKRRVLTSRTLDLFLRPDLDVVDVYDCGRLETEDYTKIFSFMPQVTKLNLRSASQIKDSTLQYIAERNIPLKHLYLDCPNLVTNDGWIAFFQKCGAGLESLALTWLDAYMDDTTFSNVMISCPNLTRLKIKKCMRLSEGSLHSITLLKNLTHLSLRFSQSHPASAEALASMIHATGPGLKTLSLEASSEADDSVLATMKSSCTSLSKLRLSENDLCTDAGFTSLFSQDWANPPLHFIDFSSARSIDYSDPDGPADTPVGLASEGFKALMAHSGSKLEHLDISSCRHIDREAFSTVFCCAEDDGVSSPSSSTSYPNLKSINISFLTRIDTPILAGLFKACPSLKKVTAFGCFNVSDVVVPRGVLLIGVPNAQEEIIKEGEINLEDLMDE